jgi:hypothetical protein
VVQTNGAPAALPAGAAAGADLSPAANYTTAVACYSPSVFFAGHRDGSVRAIQLATGDVLATYAAPAGAEMTDMTLPADKRVGPKTPLNAVPQAPSAASGAAAPASGAGAAAAAEDDKEVTAIAVWGTSPAMLAVGHRDGTIHCYAIGSGRWLLGFKTPPGLTQLLPLRRLNSLAALHEGKNIMQVRPESVRELRGCDLRAAVPRATGVRPESCRAGS